MRKFKFIQYIESYIRAPWYMGFAYYDPERGCGRCVAPIPFNMLIHWVRNFYFWMAHGYADLKFEYKYKKTRSEKMNFDQWFSCQSKKHQNEIIGKERAELYRVGELTLGSFTHKPLDLESLRDGSWPRSLEDELQLKRMKQDSIDCIDFMQKSMPERRKTRQDLMMLELEKQNIEKKFQNQPSRLFKGKYENKET